jgi:hypothetical protein
MKSLSLKCTYALSHAVIMDAIVASLQPKTAIAVSVDSSAKSLTITLRATTTLTPPASADMVLLKIFQASENTWPITVVKAEITDRQGALSQVPVSSANAAIAGNNPFRGILDARPSPIRPDNGAVVVDVRGKTIPVSTHHATAVLLAKFPNNASARPVLLIR